MSILQQGAPEEVLSQVDGMPSGSSSFGSGSGGIPPQLAAYQGSGAHWVGAEIDIADSVLDLGGPLDDLLASTVRRRVHFAGMVERSDADAFETYDPWQVLEPVKAKTLLRGVSQGAQAAL